MIHRRGGHARPAAPPSRSAATPPATPCAAGSAPATPGCAIASRGSRRSPSPTAQRIAMSCSTRTSANADSSSTSCLQPARIVDGHRDAHLRRADDVDRVSGTARTLRRPPQEAVRHQHARRGDVDDRDVALARERGERLVDRRARRDERAAAVEPAAVQNLDRDVLGDGRAGSCSGAGPWRRSTPAPRPPRTTAAARRASTATTRGSAVIMPSTSVQIWISLASSAAPRMAAE